MLIGVTVRSCSGLIGITIGVLGGFFGGRVDDAVLFAITTPAVDAGRAGGAGGGRAARQLDDLLVIYARPAAVGPLRRGGALDHHAGAQPRLRRRRLVRRLLALPHPARARCCPTSPATSSWWRRSRSRSPSCWRRRCRFLGLGVPPPLPSWGLMIAEAKDYMFFSPWVIVDPGRGAVRAGARHQPAGRRAARHVRRGDTR